MTASVFRKDFCRNCQSSGLVQSISEFLFLDMRPSMLAATYAVYLALLNLFFAIFFKQINTQVRQWCVQKPHQNLIQPPRDDDGYHSGKGVNTQKCHKYKNYSVYKLRPEVRKIGAEPKPFFSGF